VRQSTSKGRDLAEKLTCTEIEVAMCYVMQTPLLRSSKKNGSPPSFTGDPRPLCGCLKPDIIDCCIYYHLLSLNIHDKV
jgi:hypothetical protein